jgi:hypothetical protein
MSLIEEMLKNYSLTGIMEIALFHFYINKKAAG